MNVFDIIILVLVGIGTLFGLFKGLVKEVLSLLAIFLAFVFAEMFNHKLDPYIHEIVHLSDKLTTIISYILIFVATFVVMLLIIGLIEKVISKLHLSWFNYLLGAVFGGLKWAIIVSLLLNIFDVLDAKFNFVNQKNKSESALYYPILRISPTLWEYSKIEYDLNKNEYLLNEKDNS